MNYTSTVLVVYRILTLQKQKRLIDDYMVKYVVEHEMLGTITG